MGVVTGCAGGLLEGAAHMTVQRLHVVDNVWYPIIWIAAVQNAVLVGALALLFSISIPFFRNRQGVRSDAATIVVFAALFPGLWWAAREWIEGYAILIITMGTAFVIRRACELHDVAVRRFFRRAVGWMVVVTSVTFGVIEGAPRIRERRATAQLAEAERSAPNVLVVVIDTLRADHLASYGYARESSPGLDRSPPKARYSNGRFRRRATRCRHTRRSSRVSVPRNTASSGAASTGRPGT